MKRVSLKIAYIGGVKSGKSILAEKRALDTSSGGKPYYIATTEISDDEMISRIKVHQERRKDQFITIEEPLNLYETVKTCDNTILIECLSMWINNMLHHKRPVSEIFERLTQILTLNQTIIFVLNEVGFGVIPANALSRQFVDISGKVSQVLGRHCDELYFCVAGLSLRMK